MLLLCQPSLGGFPSEKHLDLPRRRFLSSGDSTIEGAKVFVVIFSENYAFSSLSLEMLTKFLDLQRRENGPVVIPVFYGDVAPSVVEQQLERFGVAFQSTEACSPKTTEWKDGERSD